MSALYPAFLCTDVGSELVQETLKSLRCPSHPPFSPPVCSAFPSLLCWTPSAPLVISPSSQDSFHHPTPAPPLSSSAHFVDLPTQASLPPQLQHMVEALWCELGWIQGVRRMGHIWVCEKLGASVPWPPSKGNLHLGLSFLLSATLLLFFPRVSFCQPPLSQLPSQWTHRQVYYQMYFLSNAQQQGCCHTLLPVTLTHRAALPSHPPPNESSARLRLGLPALSCKCTQSQEGCHIKSRMMKTSGCDYPAEMQHRELVAAGSRWGLLKLIACGFY